MTTITLRSCDNHAFVVDDHVVRASKTIENMLEDVGTGAVVPLPNVNGATLAKVIEYCTHHVNHRDEEREQEGALSEWETEFVKVDQGTMFELILAANYLDIKPLMDILCMTVARMIMGKTPEQIRQLFNIRNDFTPDEEALIREENAWAFE